MRIRILLTAMLLSATVEGIAAAQAQVDLTVPGMDCAACPITVRKALEAVTGVKAAKVDYKSKIATVQYDPDVVTVERLTKATANAGYPSTVVRDKP